MDLSNYSADDALDEWAHDRSRAPLLLKHSVDIAGVDYTIEGIIKRGYKRTVAFGALKAANIITVPKRDKVASEDPFRDQLARLWKKDRERFMAVTEELYNAAALAE